MKFDICRNCSYRGERTECALCSEGERFDPLDHTEVPMEIPICPAVPDDWDDGDEEGFGFSAGNNPEEHF